MWVIGITSGWVFRSGMVGVGRDPTQHRNPPRSRRAGPARLEEHPEWPDRQGRETMGHAPVTLDLARLLNKHPSAVPAATGLRLEYLEQGPIDGIPAVFLRGVTDSCRSFEPVLRHLPSPIRALAIREAAKLFPEKSIGQC